MRKIDNIPIRGRLIVISGPSGVGKGTLVGQILARVPGIFLSISATTRPPRAGEVNGANYYFISREEFSRKIEAGMFLEWANIYGDLYGTPREPIEQALSQGYQVVLEIDVQGAEQIRANLGAKALYVFIMPPSAEELARRLDGRKTESNEERKKRLEVADAEMALADRFDCVIINDDLDTATEELRKIILDAKD